MKAILLWVLYLHSPTGPQEVAIYPTHADCAQGKVNHTGGEVRLSQFECKPENRVIMQTMR